MSRYDKYATYMAKKTTEAGYGEPRDEFSNMMLAVLSSDIGNVIDSNLVDMHEIIERICKSATDHRD